MCKDYRWKVQIFVYLRLSCGSGNGGGGGGVHMCVCVCVCVLKWLLQSVGNKRNHHQSRCIDQINQHLWLLSRMWKGKDTAVLCFERIHMNKVILSGTGRVMEYFFFFVLGVYDFFFGWKRSSILDKYRNGTLKNFEKPLSGYEEVGGEKI